MRARKGRRRKVRGVKRKEENKKEGRIRREG
jgi:hypothetical protein